MKLLEKLRSRPEWQDDDPSVRAAAVRAMDLDADALSLFQEIARTDEDPVVRGEAVRRLEEIDDLLPVASGDPDESVRAIAVERLRTNAIEAETETRIQEILDLLSNRDLTQVSRSARSQVIGLAAVATLSDDRSLSSVARGAGNIEVAKAALARISDASVLLEVALKSEERVIALLAFDRIAIDLDVDAMTTLAKRARQKTVARRARALLDQREGPSQATDPSETPETKRVVAVPPVADSSPAEFEAERAALDEQHQQRREALAARRRLCRQVDDVAGPDADTQLAALRAQWAELPEVDVGTTGALADLRDRFDAAVARCAERLGQAAEDRIQLARLESVMDELERDDAAGASDDKRLTLSEHSWREGVAAFDGRVLDRDIESRLVAVRRRREGFERRQRDRKSEAEVAARRLHDANLEKLTQLGQSVEELIARDEVDHQTAERQLRAVRRALEDLQSPTSTLSLASKKTRDSITKRLRRGHSALVARVRELRNFADWQRWANLGVQENLCAQIEALLAVPDDAELATRYREIMSQWRQAADVPKGQGDELRRRFQLAHDRVYPRCEAYLAAQAEERQQNLARRLALIEEAERLSTSTDWLGTVKRMTELQSQWKDIGSVPRRHQRETWARFRGACNAFFTRRKDDLAKRKEVWAANLEQKQHLIAQVEALGEASELSAAVAQVKQAQTEWKTIGPVRRKQADVVWKRFRAACDAVFLRVQEVELKASADKIKVRETLCEELEALCPTETESADAPDDLSKRIKDVQQRWRQAPDVPDATRRALASRLDRAVARLVEVYPDSFQGTELDPARGLKRLESLCERAERLAGELGQATAPAGASPAEILATKWRDALASNTMGAQGEQATKRRSAVEETKKLQAERRRLGPLPGVAGEALAKRFRQACDRVFEADRLARNR